jgi:hypothetical protein
VEDAGGFTYHYTCPNCKAGVLGAVRGSTSSPTDICSSVNQVDYIQEGVVTKTTTDTVNVEVFGGANCAGQSLGTAPAAITVDGPGVNLLAKPTTIKPGGSSVLTATVSGVPDAGAYSYDFTCTTCTDGTLQLSGGGAGESELCLPVHQVTYIQQGLVTKTTTDSVGVAVYGAPGCAKGAGMLIGSASAQVTVLDPVSIEVDPPIIDAGASATVTATVTGVDAGTLSYDFNCPNCQAGTLQDVDGGEGNEVCSVSSQITYVQEGDVTQTTIDGITVTAYNGPGCADGSGIALGSATSRVTVKVLGTVSVSAGPTACAVTSDGAVMCWGGVDGVIAIEGVLAVSLVPISVAGLTSGVTAVSASGSSPCAITAGGAVMCWGSNYTGELGNGSTTSSPVPVPVTGLGSGVTAVSSSGQTACAVTGGGGVVCWGSNYDGNNYVLLGNGSTSEDSTVPVQVTGLTSGVTSVSCGEWFCCAVTAGGVVQCWGDYLPNLPSGTSSGTPTTVGFPDGVTSVSVGGGVCAITAVGGLACSGISGTGVTSVTGLTGGVSSVSCGSDSCCAVTVGGGVQCWGDNTYGELGNGSTTSSPSVPVQVFGLASGVTSVSVAGGYACATTSTGGIECWGYNSGGELGNNSTTSSSVPVSVVGFP